jgi:hypothetical protein
VHIFGSGKRCHAPDAFAFAVCAAAISLAHCLVTIRVTAAAKTGANESISDIADMIGSFLQCCCNQV